MDLLPKLIPFYLLILLGYLASKTLNLHKETISKILVYILTPAISFFGIYTMELKSKYILLSLLIFSISSIIAIMSLKITSQIYKNNPLKNILSFSAGTGNVGYFGLPIILSLLGEQAFSIAIICITGFVLYENTIGFYITARGHSEPKDALKKVMRHPLLYSIIVALTLRKLNVELSSNILEISTLLKSTYSVLGMMIIGIVLTKTNIKKLDYKFMTVSLFTKFIIWPTIIITLIKIDQNYLHFYTREVHSLLLIFSATPIAANTATFAVLLNIDDQPPAGAILTSTLLCVIIIPIIFQLL